MNFGVNLKRSDGEIAAASYEDTRVSDETELFRLKLGKFNLECGTLGDSLRGDSYSRSYNSRNIAKTTHDEMHFSTRDKDNDAFSGNCAAIEKSGWWYNRCSAANLNAPMSNASENGIFSPDGVNWQSFSGLQTLSLQETEISLLPSGWNFSFC
ncbi:unnamed protein product [Oikopleura dioica]|uniref:Fibrinogen C-terminal domain-containing protein n=1 Tax=Oikopleura dioica TaxID=34765 RepID=E4XA48_OIKDI|nr:unnamed protein product [Oikopleura dioica]